MTEIEARKEAASRSARLDAVFAALAQLSQFGEKTQ
jgi:hypothetical protein